MIKANSTKLTLHTFCMIIENHIGVLFEHNQIGQFSL